MYQIIGISLFILDIYHCSGSYHERGDEERRFNQKSIDRSMGGTRRRIKTVSRGCTLLFHSIAINSYHIYISFSSSSVRDKFEFHVDEEKKIQALKKLNYSTGAEKMTITCRLESEEEERRSHYAVPFRQQVVVLSQRAFKQAIGTYFTKVAWGQV